ncbi:MAG: type II toxin-antitoxin system HicB family antitoxin [Candidatus Hydrogenedentes bacterium]|nr:type II toxin-antitoxin system HicB family antitoxin [Candidatus Hydrogenedentota bacterium]
MAVKRPYIVLTFVISEEDGQFVSKCRELGTASCGDTFEEAAKNLREAVEVHLDALEQLGERERYFQERDIQVYTRAQAARSQPAPVETEPDSWVRREAVGV